MEGKWIKWFTVRWYPRMSQMYSSIRPVVEIKRKRHRSRCHYRSSSHKDRRGVYYVSSLNLSVPANDGYNTALDCCLYRLFLMSECSNDFISSRSRKYKRRWRSRWPNLPLTERLLSGKISPYPNLGACATVKNTERAAVRLFRIFTTGTLFLLLRGGWPCPPTLKITMKVLLRLGIWSLILS